MQDAKSRITKALDLIEQDLEKLDELIKIAIDKESTYKLRLEYLDLHGRLSGMISQIDFGVDRINFEKHHRSPSGHQEIPRQ